MVDPQRVHDLSDQNRYFDGTSGQALFCPGENTWIDYAGRVEDVYP